MFKQALLSFARLAGALTIFAACSGPSQAANPAVFPGGECTFVDQANGVRLDKCKNLTDQTVNDIHLVVSHPGMPNRAVDYGQSIGCTVFGIGNCFGPAVAPGAHWEGSGGSTGEVANILIWNADDLANIEANKRFSLDNITVTGNWTKDGVAVAPVPEPSSVVLLLAGLAGLMALARRRGGFVAGR